VFAAFLAPEDVVALEAIYEAAVRAAVHLVVARTHGIAFASAGVAVVLVALLGVIVHRPLARVPENAMKFGAGVLLSSFGTFWIVAGLGIEWPGSELAVLYVAAALSAATLLGVRLLSRTRRSPLKADPRDARDGRDAGA
jgi:Ca2+/H+ antiporter, TMEM165/GDT1 family